jgi:hypothetical protein
MPNRLISLIGPDLTFLRAEWRNSAEICALADGERHLGHIVAIGNNWHAYDATHSNDEGNGFRPLGKFASITAAKAAVDTHK